MGSLRAKLDRGGRRKLRRFKQRGGVFCTCYLCLPLTRRGAQPPDRAVIAEELADYSTEED